MKVQPHQLFRFACVFALFCFSSASNAQQKPTLQREPPVPSTGGGEHVIIHTDLVSLNVTVTDAYGRYVSGLNKDAFRIIDDKMPQEIAFFSDEDAPASIGIVFDVSGSMSGDKIRRAREALASFLATSHERDEYFLIGFNTRAQLLLDKTHDSKAILDKLTFVETRGQTALYDACYIAIEKLARGAYPKRAILLITDGQDNNSRYTFKDLRRLLKESDAIVYAIGIEGTNEGEVGISGESILVELASVSGGTAFFPTIAAEMDDVFERIALELRHQYSIGYRPANFTNDGRWHRVKVKVTPPRGLPRLFIRSREGYYATTTPR